MEALYEIFKKIHGGSIWIETVNGFEQTKERLVDLNNINPGDYFAYDVQEARIVATTAHAAPDSNAGAGQPAASAPGISGKRNKGLSYDVFRQSENGERIWVETVFGLEAVKTRLMKLSSLKPGTYVVYDPIERKFIEPFRKSA